MATKRINFTTLTPTSLSIISNYHKARKILDAHSSEIKTEINRKNLIEKYRFSYESYQKDILNGHSLLDKNIFYAYCLASIESDISKTGTLTIQNDNSPISIVIKKSFKQSVQTFLENIGAKNTDNNSALEKFSTYMLTTIDGFISAKRNTKHFEQYATFINEKHFKDLFFIAFFHYVINKYNIFDVKSDNSIEYRKYAPQESH